MSEDPGHDASDGRDVSSLVDAIVAGDRTALGRAITLVESAASGDQATAATLLTALLPHTGTAKRIGISGVPGVGKSTFIEALGTMLLDQGRRVAVLAVDPTSSRTQGSILGDKTRMMTLARRPEAFIRPSPSAGALGGVTRRTRESILVCEAAGFDVVLVETMGVGQAETAVADMVDVFLLLLLPGGGDELQGIKRGILEVTDVIAVNKADGEQRDIALRTQQEFTTALHLMRGTTGDDAPTVVTCSALVGEGVDGVWQEIDARYERFTTSGTRDRTRREQNLRWMWSLVEDGLVQALHRNPDVASRVDALEADVRDGRVLAPGAAEEILRIFRHSSSGDDEVR